MRAAASHCDAKAAAGKAVGNCPASLPVLELKRRAEYKRSPAVVASAGGRVQGQISAGAWAVRVARVEQAGVEARLAAKDAGNYAGSGRGPSRVSFGDAGFGTRLRAGSARVDGIGRPSGATGPGAEAESGPTRCRQPQRLPSPCNHRNGNRASIT